MALSVTIVPAVVPKSTAVAPAKFTPLMVTLVAPVTGPAGGLMLVTIGPLV